MKAEWKTFLSDNGAEFDGADSVLNYGSLKRELSMAMTGTVFADLSYLGLLAVRGKDALEFLQGQLTNDLRNLGESHCQLNGYCSPKGRLLASFRVLPDGDGFLLSLPRSQIEAVRKRLQMFILRAAVSLEDASDRFVRLGVSGPNAVTELQPVFPDLPGEVDQLSRNGDMLVARIAGVQPRFEVFGTLETMRKLWERLNVHCAPVGTAAWELLDILAGVPTILPETVDAFVPQMVNFQLVGGVSFKKGCFPGQEVVARMQYLGKLKRQMYLARVKTDAVPAPGADLFSPEDAEQSAGKVVTAQPHPDGGVLLLAVIQIASREAGEIHLGSADGPLLEFTELPYPLTASA